MALDRQKDFAYLREDNVARAKGEAQKIFADFGHLSEGESLPRYVEAGILSGTFDVNDLQGCCKKIDEARRTGESIYDGTLERGVRYGLKNLSGLNLNRQRFAHMDMRNFNLSDTKLVGTEFQLCDLSGATFRNAEFEHNYFEHSLLYTADFSIIRVKGEKLDLRDGGIKIEKDNIWNVDRHSDGIGGTCSDCEIYNRAILGMSAREEDETLRDRAPLKRRGTMLFQESRPLGYMKLKGDRTFLAMRTVWDSAGEAIFWKGMIYALDYDLVGLLEDRSDNFTGAKEWRRADIEVIADLQRNLGEQSKFSRNNKRFLDYPEIFHRLTEVTKGVEDGTEPFVDIFADEAAEYHRARNENQD